MPLKEQALRHIVVKLSCLRLERGEDACIHGLPRNGNAFGLSGGSVTKMGAWMSKRLG